MSHVVSSDGGGYFAQLAQIVSDAAARLARAPSHSRRAVAARHWARRSLIVAALVAVAIGVLMVALDAAEIGWMPTRGTASLWPVRILTDFGKGSYVLGALAALLIATIAAAPRLRGTARAIWISLVSRIGFVFAAVLTAEIVGEIIKGVAGRGRPFVGGAANAYNFRLFAWNEAFASFPSSHAVVASALAFAIATLWPRALWIAVAYAVAIALSRLVLLAHHPSDVVAGALVGVLGAMAVRYWFAARRVAFVIRADGSIEPLPGPSFGHLKKVARDAIAP